MNATPPPDHPIAVPSAPLDPDAEDGSYVDRAVERLRHEVGNGADASRMVAVEAVVLKRLLDTAGAAKPPYAVQGVVDRVLARNNAIRTCLAVVSCVAVTVSTIIFFKIRNLSASADAAERAGDFNTALATLAAMGTWVSVAQWMMVLGVAAGAVTLHCVLISRWISRSRVNLEAPTQHLDGGPAAGGPRLPVVVEATPT